MAAIALFIALLVVFPHIPLVKTKSAICETDRSFAPAISWRRLIVSIPNDSEIVFFMAEHYTGF